MSLPPATCGDPARFTTFMSAVLGRLEAIPGTQGAATTTSLPLERGPDVRYTAHASQKGQDVEGGAEFRAISAKYFEVMRIPLREGRPFADSDTVRAEPVVIVNERLAAQRWPGRPPVGQMLSIGKSMGPSSRTRARSRWIAPLPRCCTCRTHRSPRRCLPRSSCARSPPVP
jgi:putative ABC transport system permease protein